jgi:hypothetical protein
MRRSVASNLTDGSLSNKALQLTGLVGRRFASLTRSLWRPQLNATTLGARHLLGRGKSICDLASSCTRRK